MAPDLRHTGISIVGRVPWGTHFSVFYESAADLLEVIVPFFTAGLDNNEFCLCTVAQHITGHDVVQALRQAVPDVDRYFDGNAIEIVRAEDFYAGAGPFDAGKTTGHLRERLDRALSAGFSGLRVNGDEAWLGNNDWTAFSQYEQALGQAIAGTPSIVLCAYRLEASSPGQILDVAQAHEFVIAKRGGQWERLETTALKETKHELEALRDGLERRVIVRTRQLEQTNEQLRTEIIERKQAQAALSESEERFAKAFRSSPISNTISRAADGRFIEVNDAFVRMFGYERAEVVGRSAVELNLWIDPAERPLLMNTLKDKGSIKDFEARARTKSGEMLELVLFGERIEVGGDECLLMTAYDRTSGKRAERALQAASDQLKALSRRLVEIQEAERRQLARELHDRIGQNLTALGINLDIVTAQSAKAAGEVRSRLEDSIALVESTADAIVNVLSELRPPMLDDLGLLPALEWYAREFSTRTGVDVSVVGDDQMRRPPPGVDIALFRIAQEALNNVAKHARAQSVDIELTSNSEWVLTISDNGVGLAARAQPQSCASSGFGMVTMRERALAIGGRFEVLARAGGGTSVVVRVPSP
jgi:PAS domain S-box-containing protein